MGEDNYQNLKRHELIKEATTPNIEYCDVCDGVLNWNILPTTLHRDFYPCDCIRCKCGNKDEGKFSPLWDEDGIYKGLQCDECKHENIEELSSTELNMMSKE